jgi:hypothetical protein
MNNAKPRLKSKPKISEAHIERTCSEWLALDGWRLLKTNPVSDRSRGKGFGEVGMADCLYIRYINWHHGWRSDAQVMWIEWKAKGGKLGAHQKAWHAHERAVGGMTLMGGVDFEASIEGFQDWYRKSILSSRKI